MQVPCASHASLCWDKLGLSAGTVLTPPLHPDTAFTRAALEGLLLFLLLWVSVRDRVRSWPFRGCSSLAGLFRFAVEFVRMPDVQLATWPGWVTMGQLLSAPMIVVGIVLLILAYRNQGRA